MEKYRTIETIGRGAFGVVYLCEKISDKSKLVMKKIPVNQMSNDDRETSLNEARVHSMLNHPNIIAYYENFIEKEDMVIVMEYAEGGTLNDFLVARNGCLLDEETVLKYFVQLVLGLQHIHSYSILHRDLKSHNILLDKNKLVVKISDFGISKVLSTKSKALTVVGTPNYISPELCEGKPYCRKSDIWALGCVLYELLTLRRPFEGDNLSALVMKIVKGDFEPIPNHFSRNIKQLVYSMLHIDPNKRPDTPQMMAQPFIVPTIFEMFVQIGCIPMTNRNAPDTPVVTSDFSFDVSASSSELSKDSECSNSETDLKVWFIKDSKSASECFTVPFSDRKNLAKIVINKLKHESNFLAKNFNSSNSSPEKNCGKVLIEDFVDCATGKGYSICLSKSNIVSSMGKVASGCLGRSANDDSEEPTIIEDIFGHNIVSIDSGSKHVMVVSDKHKVFGWGYNAKGCLGLNKSGYFILPQMIHISKHRVKQVICGYDCTFALTTHNVMLACGSNRYNKLGMNFSDASFVEQVPVLTPVQSEPLPNVTIIQIAPGKSHTAVLTDDGKVYTFGSNRHKQLGRVDSQCSFTLPGLLDVGSVTSVSCGDTFTTVVTQDHQSFLWGVSPKILENESSFVEIHKLPFLNKSKILQVAAHENDLLLITE